jgi:hypothetical protein
MERFRLRVRHEPKRGSHLGIASVSQLSSARATRGRWKSPGVFVNARINSLAASNCRSFLVACGSSKSHCDGQVRS